MTTYDIELGGGIGWVAVVPLGTVVFIHNVTSHTLYYRFGIDGSSSGIPLHGGDFIEADETVYIRDNIPFKTKATIVGD